MARSRDDHRVLLAPTPERGSRALRVCASGSRALRVCASVPVYRRPAASPPALLERGRRRRRAGVRVGAEVARRALTTKDVYKLGGRESKGYPRPMPVAIGIFAALLVLLFAPSAGAATPLAPASGSAFTTTDTVTFEAQPAPEESDADYMFVFSLSPDFTANEWFAFGGAEHRLDDVDLGWLAGKVDHVGTYWWALCSVAADSSVITDQCSPSWTFSLRFRLPDLTKGQARADARYVMNHKFRSYWRGGYNRKVSCRRVTRTRQRCKVSVLVGDVSVWGRVTVYLKRRGNFPNDFYRARIQIYNEYCHLVNGRPFRECMRTRRLSGPVYEF
jgi:hypothetical protein